MAATEAESQSDRFRSLIEITEDFVAIADPHGRLKYANLALRRLLGLGADDDITQTSIADCHPPEDTERLVRDVFGAVLREGSWTGEVNWQGRDGRVVPTRLVSNAHRNDEGEVEYCSVIAHDISALKVLNKQVLVLNQSLEERVAQRTAHLLSTQEELRDEKERAQRYLDIAGVILVALDVDARVTMINRSGCQLLADHEANIIGKNWIDEFLCRSEVESVRAGFVQLLAGNVDPIESFENHVISRDKRERLIAWRNTILCDEEGRIIGTLSSGEDITEQRNAENALRASESQLRLITDGLPVLVARVDQQGRYRFNNAAYERFFGIPTNALKGRLVRETIGEQAFAQAQPHMREALDGQTSTFESQLINKDRQVRDVVTRYEPDIDGAGEVVGFLVVVADITERKQLANALRQSQKMEAVGQLASGIAHDFNNLLMGIGGCADVALSRLHDGAAVRMLLDEIRSAAASGGNISRQLLDFSRHTEAGAEAEGLVLDALVASNELMLGRLLGENVALRLDLGCSPERVQLLPGQIEQVVMNLVLNARDAMPGGGEIDIETRDINLGPDRARLLGGLEPGRYLTLSVRDTGHGMDAATIERIFEPFFTTKEVGKGTGLGLSSVYGIVTQRGGYVDVQSRLGAGTTFTIYFPWSGKEGKNEDAREIRGRRGTETVLVVEDDRLVQLALREYLSRWGYEVLVAGDGSQAVQVARDHRGRLSLLISDMILPGISGSKVAEKVTEIHPESKVIYMSAHSREMLAEAGHLPPGTETLQKPFGEEELLARVRDLLSES